MRGAESVVGGNFERASDERGLCWWCGRWRGWGRVAAAVEAVLAALVGVVVDTVMAGFVVVVVVVVVLVVDDA